VGYLKVKRPFNHVSKLVGEYVDEDFKSLIQKLVKVVFDSGENKVSVSKGIFISASESFVTVLDERTTKEVFIPRSRIIRIEVVEGDKNSKEDQTQ